MPGRSSSHDLPGQRRHHPAQAPSVAEAVAAAMNDYGNSGRGTHPEALEAARSIYGVRQALAALFGCSRADRVAFTPNSTMALNIAISGLLGAGDHVISTDLEHNSVLRPLYRLRAQGGAVDFVPADRQGRIDYEDLSGSCGRIQRQWCAPTAPT